MKKNLKKNFFLVVCGGGTGGHLFPAITVAEELLKNTYQVELITDPRGYKLIKHNKNQLAFDIFVLPLRNFASSFITKFLFFIMIFFSTLISIKKFIFNRPSAVVGFGGYPSFPSLLAAIFLKIPIVIYEQNAILGKTNRFFSRFATLIALAYVDTKFIPTSINASSIISVGEIIRPEILKIPQKENFNSSKIMSLLVIGGSQSAKIFSTLVPKIMTILKNKFPSIDISITQQANKLDHDFLSKTYKSLNISCHLSTFFNNIAEEYQKADLVISRAGAVTIGELINVALPAILIPLPTSAENHQLYNARALAEKGAAWCYEEKNINPEHIADKIALLANNRNLLKTASINLKKQQKRKGTKILIDTIKKIIN